MIYFLKHDHFLKMILNDHLQQSNDKIKFFKDLGDFGGGVFHLCFGVRCRVACAQHALTFGDGGRYDGVDVHAAFLQFYAYFKSGKVVVSINRNNRRFGVDYFNAVAL